MDQQRRSARQADMSARPRHAHSRARRKTARPSQQSSAAADQHRPVIVVGYDATPEARAALAFAVRRARPHGTVVAVHAIAPARAYLGSPYYDRAVERAQLDGRMVLDPVPAAGIETALLEGRPADVLARIADQRGASEIVVGSPKPAWVRALVGSRVVRRLVATAGRPVVVVPAPPAR